MEHGLLLIDKPAGCTSHDVVQRSRRAVGQKKIGHCGTLDPAATGLLVLTLGKATRLTRFLIRAPKVYEGEVQLGMATDTYDAAGEMTDEAPIDTIDLEAVREAMAAFVGEYEHLTPPYSARKLQGVKSYELARRGEHVPEQRKRVNVYEYASTSELSPEGRFSFRLSCSSGTYARSLAHELGIRLGCGGHLAALRRITVGGFQLGQAATLEALEEATGLDELEAWIPFDRIPLPFEQVEVDTKQEQRITHGQTVLMRGLESSEGDWIKVDNRRGEFLAVASVIEQIGAEIGVLQPRIVFK
jgi:tRNA pseudouridine55 synthase